MKYLEFIIATIGFMFLFVVLIGIPVGIHQQAEFKKSCEVRGGTFININYRSSSYMCVKLEKI